MAEVEGVYLNSIGQDYLDWLDFKKIVEIASQIILQIYLNDELFINMAIENKVDNSPLTIAIKWKGIEIDVSNLFRYWLIVWGQAPF